MVGKDGATIEFVASLSADRAEFAIRSIVLISKEVLPDR